MRQTTIGDTTYANTFDDAGNMVSETTSRHFEWDYASRMRVYRTQVDGSEPTVYAHYLYGAGGERVKKLVRTQGGEVDVTVYIDGILEHDRIVGATLEENDTLHVMDGVKRIATQRVGPAFQDDATPAVKYQLGDHLGSSHVVIDDMGALVNREEYRPYGETSFGSFGKKRYRFNGKERDEESGLYYYGARYYAPWLSRWTAADPMGTVDGTNLYAYVRGSPVNLVDPNGTQQEVPDDFHAEGVKVTPLGEGGPGSGGAGGGGANSYEFSGPESTGHGSRREDGGGRQAAAMAFVKANDEVAQGQPVLASGLSDAHPSAKGENAVGEHSATFFVSRTMCAPQ